MSGTTDIVRSFYLRTKFEADNSQIFHRPLEDYYRTVKPAKCIHQLKN